MKSLVGEFTQNEKWSVKGTLMGECWYKDCCGEFTQNEKWSIKGSLMGECWYKDCCVSEYMESLRCGKPEVEGGDEKMRTLIRSEEVQRLMRDITLKEYG